MVWHGPRGPSRPGRVALLFGDPVAHSLSPLIHNTAFQAAGIDAEYRARRVNTDDLGEAVSRLRSPEALGANVTVPHKQAVMPFLDVLTPVARTIGAVNMITRLDDGTLRGDNTDAAGFLRGLDVEAMRGAPALVFGAGGAARAVVYALLTEVQPATLSLVARRPAQAEALATEFATLDTEDSLRFAALHEAGETVRASRLLVNATPLGMHPDVDTTPWTDARDFHNKQTVYDLVYAPATTRLLHEAQAHGALTVGGLAMLVGQAAAAFEQWTGVPMPLGAVEDALRAHGVG